MDERGLGRRLQEARLQSGLTQQALCQKAGLSYSTLTKIERGAIKSPSIFTIHHIADALGMGLDELMGVTIVHKQKQRSKSGVSFVYFDINGCLVHFFYYRAFSRLAQQSGVPAEVVETTFWRYNDDVCRGNMTMDEFNRVFAAELGLQQLNWLECYLEALEPIESMHKLITEVSKDYRVGLLTNIMPGFVDELIARGLLPKIQYESIVDSSKAGSIKPEQHMYELAAQQAGVPPSEIMLVDDTQTNIMAAERQGWHVLWFDDYDPQESVDRIRNSLEPAA